MYESHSSRLNKNGIDMIGTREIKVHVGLGLDNKGIRDTLNSCSDSGEESHLMFEVAHALLNDHKDDRAEIYSVSVDEVTVDPIHPSQVQIEFTTSWFVYYGCKNMNMQDEEFMSASATYTEVGDLVFIVPSPRRPASHC